MEGHQESANQPDGSPLYLHIITPVVKDADYTITNLVYEVVTDPIERTTSSTFIKEPCRSRCS